MNSKRVLCMVFTASMMLFALTGCRKNTSGNRSSTGTAKSGRQVELRWLSSQIGETLEARWFSNTVDKFNTANSGLIKINVDGVAGEANVEKLRTDAAGNTMPDLYMLFADAARFQLIADSGRGVDLMPYMRANPELWARVDKDSAAVYTDSKGQLLGLPFVKAYIGIYYNKAIFDAAGVTQFPTTWDGFFDACEKIKASRVAPIAFMTGENSWTTMLMLSHIIGTSDGGVQWLKSTPETVKFTDPVFVQAVEKLQRMMRNYATPDSIGATYAVAASAFNNGMAAMICNGPWMCADFYNTDVAMDGLSRNVVYALAPGGGAIQNENMAYASGSRTKESADAAFEVLKYLASPAVYAEYLNVTSGAPALAIDESLLNIDPIIKKFQSQAVDAPRRYGQFSNCVKQACIDGLGQLLPDLASGTMTPRQFAEQMQRISDSNR